MNLLIHLVTMLAISALRYSIIGPLAILVCVGVYRYRYIICNHQSTGGDVNKLDHFH